ncbi:hypothetical protein Gotur_022594, partial [Gossypium turneri]
LWGIWDGLLLLQKKGHDKALVQPDCLEVVKAIQEGDFVSSNLVLLQRIMQLLQNKDHWVIRHMPRESNQVNNLIVPLSSDEKEAEANPGGLAGTPTPPKIKN